MALPINIEDLIRRKVVENVESTANSPHNLCVCK